MTQLKDRSITVPYRAIVEMLASGLPPDAHDANVSWMYNSVYISDNKKDCIYSCSTGRHIQFGLNYIPVVRLHVKEKEWHFLLRSSLSPVKTTKGDSDVLKFIDGLLEAMDAPFRYVCDSKNGLCIQLRYPAVLAGPIPLESPWVSMSELDGGVRRVGYIMRSQKMYSAFSNSCCPRITE